DLGDLELDLRVAGDIALGLRDDIAFVEEEVAGHIDFSPVILGCGAARLERALLQVDLADFALLQGKIVGEAACHTHAGRHAGLDAPELLVAVAKAQGPPGALADKDDLAMPHARPVKILLPSVLPAPGA